MNSRTKNILMTSCLSFVAASLLIPSIIIAAKDGYFFDNSKKLNVDLENVNQENISLFPNLMVNKIQNSQEFKVKSFYLEFDSDGKMKNSIINFETVNDKKEYTNYQFKTSDKKTGVILEIDKRKCENLLNEEISLQVFNLIQNTYLNDSLEYRYNFDGIYENKGKTLDVGITDEIKNYLYVDDSLNQITSLKNDKSYLKIKKIRFDSGIAVSQVRYFLPL